MKLKDLTTNEELLLPNSLYWSDEFRWASVVSGQSYTLTGALLVEQGTRLAGRPISFITDDELNWVSRTAVKKLLQWAEIAGRRYLLTLAYVSDIRTFVVIFDTTNSPIEVDPVSTVPSHRDADQFHLRTLKLIQVE